MNDLKNSAILGAGQGSRLSEVISYKPFLPWQGTFLLDVLLSQIDETRIFSKTFVILNSKAKNFSKELNCLSRGTREILIRDTPSSLHTLYEAVKALRNLPKKKQGTHLWVSMVDTVIADKDLQLFLDHCKILDEKESSVLLTSYIEDENPLYAKMNSEMRIVDFHNGDSGVELPHTITSGMYCFSLLALSLLDQCILEGMQKMRNFLKILANDSVVKGFVVKCTLDLDRKEDWVSAKEVFGLCKS